MVTRRSFLALSASAAGGAALLAACGGSGGPSAGGAADLKVAYLESPPSHDLTDMFSKAKTAFQAANAGSAVALNPVNASETDFYTKLALMQRSSSTAPDLVYEDSFQVNSDADAGYLKPIGDYVGAWSEWGQYGDRVRQAGQSVDGTAYTVPLETDVQIIWYNKKIFKAAGLPTTWQPTSWADIQSAAAAVKKIGGVVPLNLYVTKASGEATTLRGVQNLLVGTPGALESTFYDHKTSKWVLGSGGLVQALGFLHDTYAAQFLPTVTDLENPNLQNVLSQQMFPAGKVAMLIDGSWLSGNWATGGSAPWPTWKTDVGVAAIPRRTGGGQVTMSGGWTIGISAKSTNADAAWNLLKTINSKALNLSYCVASSNVPVRSDVAADPTYTGSLPQAAFVAKLLADTNYRPALTMYPQVSDLLQQAAEATTIGGTAPDKAASTYDAALKDLVGGDNTQTATS